MLPPLDDPPLLLPAPCGVTQRSFGSLAFPSSSSVPVSVTAWLVFATDSTGEGELPGWLAAVHPAVATSVIKKSLLMVFMSRP